MAVRFLEVLIGHDRVVVPNCNFGGCADDLSDRSKIVLASVPQALDEVWVIVERGLEGGMLRNDRLG
ncbi:hypothetical protein QA648_24770 (plasmid) [Rhizobium sp. CB3171]|uniref:hypothetical protein n=1 Tax=Rhizobium sp. CB3171 TaxID=3039157 RepID=UPI0024B0FC5B|nr:hypothetical protein [Rhizobium sp. CB3171]WFU06322.1 hypothetical protein QA648_24770 [Rhizobium sp. CB3171]